MIRITTFAILAVVVALGLGVLVPTDGIRTLLPYGFLLVAWIAIYEVCDRGRFANYLGNIDEEAKQISWPSGVQMLHCVKVVVFLMTVLCMAFCCIDALITYPLDISR